MKNEKRSFTESLNKNLPGWQKVGIIFVIAIVGLVFLHMFAFIFPSIFLAFAIILTAIALIFSLFTGRISTGQPHTGVFFKRNPWKFIMLFAIWTAVLILFVIGFIIELT